MHSGINEILSNPNLNSILNIFIFIFGLCFGSFINVCIYRIPRKESIIFTPSHCTTCGHKIRFHENIPLLSWLFLKGKCSNCRDRIPFIYPIVEIITGSIIFLLWLKAKQCSYPLPEFLVYINLIFLLIPTFFIDIKFFIIPNKLTYPVIIISFFLSFLFPETMNFISPYKALLNSILGFAAPTLILLAFSYLSKLICKKETIGLGDIKYMAAIGAAFGFVSFDWLGILIISTFTGAVFGLFYILFSRKSLMFSIPFGPFLVIGTLIWIFEKEFIKTFYIEILQNILL